MKIRNGFVTNSSSSSFIIAKKHLDDDQIKAIHNHIELAKLMGDKYADKYDEWSISENEEYVSGATWMDNFYMGGFLDDIGVNPRRVIWSEFPFNVDNYRDEINYENGFEEKEDEWRVLLEQV